jgi:predicted DNA binding CopG/RHH family protein
MEQNDEFESAKKGVKKTKRLAVSISSETFDRLKSYIEANGYDTSKLVDKILQKFLDVKK